MARPKKDQTVVVGAQPAAPAAPMESGLGNLSEADLAAIRGGLPADEILTSGAPASSDHAPMGDPATPSEIAILKAAFEQMVARVVTAEAKVDRIERAMEQWAAEMNNRPAMPVANDAPAPTHPASPDEEAAYSAINFQRWKAGQKQFGGIQEWRKAGSPKVASAA